jgi:hypothetical protein
MSSAFLLTAIKLLLPVEPAGQCISVHPGDSLSPGAHNTITITACTNYNPDKLTFTTPANGGQPPYTYQWQSGSSAAGPWTAITGATDMLYDPPNLISAGTYCFNCKIKDDIGTEVMTASKMIIIVPDPTVTVSGGGIVSLNSAATLQSSVTDGTGIITYQWYASLTGISGWVSIPGANASSYKLPASSAGLFYYRVRADASGAACSKPYSQVIAIIIVPDTSLPTFSAPPGPFTFCVENIAVANFGLGGSGADNYRPDFYAFRKGDHCFDLNPEFFRDDCESTFGFFIRWEFSTNGLVTTSGIGQPADHEYFEIPGSPSGVVIHNITWWISDCNGNESLPVTRDIIIKPRPQIIIN